MGSKKTEIGTEKAQEELKTMGWKILIIWECELPDLDKVKRSLKESL